MRRIIILLAVFTYSLMSSAQTDSTEMESDKAAVKSLIERFLTAAGNYDIDAMPEMFCAKANIGGASFRNGKWESFTFSFSEFLDLLKSRSNPKNTLNPFLNIPSIWTTACWHS